MPTGNQSLNGAPVDPLDFEAIDAAANAKAAHEPAGHFDAPSLAYMRLRSIDPEVARREGCKSLTEEEARRFLGNPHLRGGALAIQYDPERCGLEERWRFKPYLRVYPYDRTTNPRALTPKKVEGEEVAPFVPSTTGHNFEPLYVTEAPTKALAMLSHGFENVVGCGGVSAGIFVAGSRPPELQAAVSRLLRPGRRVYVVFDSNRATNPRVAAAEAKVARAVIEAGCQAFVVGLPPVRSGRSIADQGVDDFLSAHGRDALQKLIERARPADPVEWARLATRTPAEARELLRNLPFLAAMQAARETVTQVAAELKGIWGKVDLNRALREFEDELRADDDDANAPRVPGETGADWETELLRTDAGVIKCQQENIRLILTHDPEMKDRLGYDELLCSPVWMLQSPDGLLPRPRERWTKWSDEDETAMLCWLQRRWEVNVQRAEVGAVASMVSKRFAYHPVRRLLSGVTYDGESRLDGWLSKYLGVEDSPYTRRVGRYWLISAVARAFKPGCQADYALILENTQGTKKSTGLRTLACEDKFFTDDIRSLGDIESCKQLAGKWIVEISELAAMRKVDADVIRQFVTKRADNYRPSYGRVALDFPRQCVFAGTVNPTSLGYLQDQTGNRRFWPVKQTREADIQALTRDRLQLWAEALVRYNLGEHWWPTAKEEVEFFRPEQERRRAADVSWEEAVADYVSTRDHVRMGDILSTALGVDIAHQGQREQTRVANILHNMRWQRGYRYVDGQSVRVWEREPGADPKHTVEPSVRSVDFLEPPP